MCLAAQPFCATISLPASAFVAGESIPITVDVENGSNVKINSIRVIVRRHIVCIAHYPKYIEKKRTTNIAEGVIGHVDANSTDTIRQMFKIPNVPPHSMHCRIFKWSYDLKVYPT